MLRRLFIGLHGSDGAVAGLIGIEADLALRLGLRPRRVFIGFQRIERGGAADKLGVLIRTGGGGAGARPVLERLAAAHIGLRSGL